MTIKTEQLAFKLVSRTALEREQFYVSNANRKAVEVLDNWKSWPQRMLTLVGPKSSGKSHLVAVWRSETNAVLWSPKDIIAERLIDLNRNSLLVVEDVDRILSSSVQNKAVIEELLVHLVNVINSGNGRLLFTAKTPASSWNIQLPDLLSRLVSIQSENLFQPDDKLIMALLIKHFNDRQLRVTSNFIDYVFVRIDRSFEAVQNFVATIDSRSLSSGSSLSISLARNVLKEVDAANETMS